MMARQTGSSDSITVEYFTWEAAGGRFLVHMHRDAVDGLARDVIERSQGLPVEVGGLLLGHAGRGERPVVWIERYHRIECQHRSGPHFILDREEHEALETAAAELTGDLNVVGFYRSHLRPGFQLEAADFELTDRYFKDPEDLFLLIRPLENPANRAELLGQFFIHYAADGGQLRPADPSFPFRGRVVEMANAAAENQTPVPSPVGEAPAPKPPRRLVPDFGPATETPRPAREIFFEERASPRPPSTEELNPSRGHLRGHWPLVTAIVLVGCAVAVFRQQAAHQSAAEPPAATENTPVLPLGLFVDPAGAYWRITWRTSATALQGARSVQLFVRDGDEQNRIDLTPRDLAAGAYRYPAKTSDVTFRLEAKDAAGHVSAESFRMQRIPKKPADRPPAPEPPAAKVLHPRVIGKVAPVVPTSIRPRIRGTVPVDVRVRIDEQGHVTSAVPISKGHSGLESFLAERAVAAAKQWRYQPGAPGAEIIHFSFTR